MKFIQKPQIWAKGDLLQGKIMLGVSIVLLLVSIAIFRGESEVLCGGLIPLGLTLVVLMGYSTYVMSSRQIYIQEMTSRY
ncbi:MAG: hypothetical protein AAF927_00980 [Bacteroidota bacterium]